MVVAADVLLWCLHFCFCDNLWRSVESGELYQCHFEYRRFWIFYCCFVLFYSMPCLMLSPSRSI